MEENILELNHITKSFPGVRALTDVSLNIREGEIHGLVGENGAGKSTLIKIMCGIYQPDEGSMRFGGEEYRPGDTRASRRLGISVVHQELKLVDTLSIMENIFLGRPQTNRRRLIDWKTMRREAEKLIGMLGVAMEPEELVGQLSIAQKQIVEIMKAISIQAKLVIMDEPSATLTAKEMENLYEIIKKLKKQGISIIYISHRLEEIFDLCDRISVLRDGQKIDTLPIGDVTRGKLISLMVGRELGMEYPKTKSMIGECVLQVEHLTLEGAAKDVNFTLHRGEILGFAGLVGAGRTEMIRALLGVDKGAKGTVFLNGQKYRIRDMHAAVKSGFGFVTEDRKNQGLMLKASIRENISIVKLKNIFSGGVLSLKKDGRLARDMMEKLKIAAPGEETPVLNLSGGNQQKVVIGKWLNADSDILVIDEPTRGIDVGAKAEIYKILCQLAGQGKAIIMISSDMPELLSMSDRIVVMRENRITAVFGRDEATQDQILEKAIG